MLNKEKVQLFIADYAITQNLNMSYEQLKNKLINTPYNELKIILFKEKMKLITPMEDIDDNSYFEGMRNRFDEETHKYYNECDKWRKK